MSTTCSRVFTINSSVSVKCLKNIKTISYNIQLYKYTSVRGKLGFMRFKKIYEISEPAGDDEPSTVGVRLVPGDTPEDVVEKILDLV